MRKIALVLFIFGLVGTTFGIDRSKKLEISVGLWDIQSAFADANDQVLKFVQDKFNVTFKPVNFGWDDWSQKLKLWAASGDMPDIVSIVDRADQLKMIKQNVFRPLPADLSSYPVIKSIVAGGDVQPLAVGGKLYELPRMSVTDQIQGYGPDRTIIVRKDWMQKLGLTKLPTTFEEFYNFAKAFVDKGKGVYGIEIGNPGWITNMMVPDVPGVAVGFWVPDSTGKWVPQTTTKEFVTALGHVARLYRDGILDPDAFILKDKDGQDRFAQGKAGILMNNGGPVHLKQIYDRWVSYPGNPDFASSVVIIPEWKNADGKYYYTGWTRYWSSSMFSSKVSDEKMARILAIYDYLLTDEGMRLTTYGLEGVDYTMTADGPKIIREKDPATGQNIAVPKKYPSVGSLWANLAAWTQDLNMWKRDAANYTTYGAGPVNIAMDAMEWRKAHEVPFNPNWKIFFLDYPDKGKFATVDNGFVAYTDAVKIVTGTEDVPTAWAKVLDKYKSQGLDKIIADVNAAIK